MAESVHPLLNNVVTKEVLKYSTVRDLAAHRLVCKTWFELSLTQWRSTATLSILQGNQPNLDDNDDEYHEYDDEVDSSITLQELKNILGKGGLGTGFLRMDTKPFAKYRLNKWEIKEISEDQDNISPHRPKRNLNECSREELICGAENFPLFWEEIGPLMRSLSFDEFEVERHHLLPLLAIIFEHTPNLAALKFFRPSFRRRIRHVNVSKIKHELQRLNLEPKSTLKRFSFNIPVIFEDLLGYFPNLENFGIERASTRSAMKRLREMKDKSSGELSPLKTLEVGSLYKLGVDGEKFADSISQTLDTYDDLEVIKLYMSPFCRQTRDLDVTRMMENVKHFEVWGNWLRSLGFLRWMPNLETLEVHISCFEKWDKMPQLEFQEDFIRKKQRYVYVTNFNQDIVQNALQSHPAMNGYVADHLKSLYIDYEFGTESLKTLSKWMPHLKELKTILNNETLRTVCELWSDLEKLDVLYGSSVDDEGITGISENKEKVGGSQKQKANLTNLKKLKSFRLETYCGLSKLGDISAAEAFLKMDTLQFLEICVSSNMSVDVEAQLKEAILNANIIRNYGDDEPSHLRYKKCCKRFQFLFESVEGAITAYEQSGSSVNVDSPVIRRLKQLLEEPAVSRSEFFIRGRSRQIEQTK